MNARTCLFASAILLALLPGCGGGSAVEVAGKFWKAVNDGDIEKARSYATSGSAETLTMNDNGGNAEVDVEFGAATVEGERTTIETHMMTRMGDFSQTVEMKTVLAMEDGEWKVDVMSTMMSMFGDAAQQMMEGMTEAMGQTVEAMGNAMMEEMQKGFQQFMAHGITRPQVSMAPEVLPEETQISIKFGYMKKREDGSHYVYKETTKIPMRTNGFQWGYSIEAEGDRDPFTTYSIDYSPDGPMDGSGYPRMNAEGKRGWESNTNTVTNSYFSHTYRNDPGDTPGERAIEIYIDDKLATTIEFAIDIEIENP